MIRWMLGRLEKDPHTVFYEKELLSKFPVEFQQARGDRLLTRIPLQLREGVIGSYGYNLPRPYTVVFIKGRLEAFDDEDPEVDPIELKPEDLTQWSLDLNALALKIQEANSLGGKPEALSDWMYFLGERRVGDNKTAYVLGLMHSEVTAMEKLMTLSGLLPRGYSRRAVLCPSFELPPTARRQAQGLGVDVLPLCFQSPGSFALAEVVTSQQMDADFQHSEDYRTVKRRGETFQLTPLQSQVVGILHHALMTGTPGLSWQAISPRLTGNASRMSDIFKKSDPRSTLVPYERKGRIYHLDI